MIRRLKRRCTNQDPSCSFVTSPSLSVSELSTSTVPIPAGRTSRRSTAQGQWLLTTSHIGAEGTASERRSAATQPAPGRRQTNACHAFCFLDPENSVPSLSSSSTAFLRSDSFDGLRNGGPDLATAVTRPKCRRPQQEAAVLGFCAETAPGNRPRYRVATETCVRLLAIRPSTCPD
ncbi:hypothetical protein PG999_014423 [Apiospora kogelbergensis]|uniref:Uncharacterized protein n=1 Tax=Apiospora kogelbergensis TaxID=1337665 RepID=A0AAW0QBD4_9PEZI